MPWVPKSALRESRDDFEFKHDLVEVALVPQRREDETAAAAEVYDYMCETFDRGFRVRTVSGYTTAARMAMARYRELRAEGLSYDEAIEEMRKVVRWCKRNWWTKPEMREYCAPAHIFRPKKFHDRRR